MGSIVAQRTFDIGDQRAFAQLSGDVNPLHMDPALARRSQTGDVVVHGMHIALWALDVLCRKSPGLHVNSFRACFTSPLRINERADLKIVSQSSHETKVDIEAAGAVVCELALSSVVDPLATPLADAVTAKPENRDKPVELLPEQLPSRRGAVSLAESDACIAAFPALCTTIGAPRVAGLIGTTRVVGMECPGLFSLYSKIGATFHGDDAGNRLRFAVARYDSRFRCARIEVAGAGVRASLEAFLRLPPIAQPTMREVAERVRPDVFAGQRVLIVGGSRGLGEATAKIIAAGGGVPMVTYARGRTDAQRVAEDICSWGAICTIAPYDARAPAQPQLGFIEAPPASLYYFATGPIFARAASPYDPDALHEFMTIYVEGFATLCATMPRPPSGRMRAFYPSTAALDSWVRGFGEYAMAKAAGELLCRHLERSLPGLSIVVKRLPRVLTDLTATVIPADAETAIDVMIPIVAETQHAL